MGGFSSGLLIQLHLSGICFYMPVPILLCLLYFCNVVCRTQTFFFSVYSSDSISNDLFSTDSSLSVIESVIERLQRIFHVSYCLLQLSELDLGLCMVPVSALIVSFCSRSSSYYGLFSSCSPNTLRRSF